jgi:hypothetical protein
MKIIALISVFIVFVFCDLQGQNFEQKTIEIGNIGMTLSNFGTFGQPNIRSNPSGPPSMEYPLNSGIEHLFEGGLWIGALVNGQPRVSTSAMDAPGGYYAGGGGFEFTALSKIKELSSLSYSNFFSSSALSHQDMQVAFTDSNTIIPGTNIKIYDHSFPLKALVDLETYAWNYSFADFFVIYNYKITNASDQKWDSVYFGTWTDLVVRNVNVTQDVGTAFYNKGGGGFIDSFTSIYAYQVYGDDIDYTQSYGATQFLGIEWRGNYIHPNNAETLLKKGYSMPVCNGNFWVFRTFEGGPFGAPETDLMKYEKLAKGLDFKDVDKILRPLKSAGNRIQLISAGPVSEILPGESVYYTIAMVCAKQMPDYDPLMATTDTEKAREKLMEHMNWARRTYLGEDVNENGILDEGEDLNQNGKLNRYILPEPPATPKVKYIASSNKVDIYWDNKSVSSIDPISKKRDFEGYRLYRSNIGDDLKLNMTGNAKIIAQWDSAHNNIGYNNGFESIALKEPLYFENDTTAYHFHYSIDNLLNGWQYMFILTAFDKGDQELNLESLESSVTENAISVFSGTPADNTESSEIGVYPNPYKLSAAWDGSSSTTKKIYFYNLPDQCEIFIYTLNGDIVARLYHNSSEYQGDDIKWFRDFSAQNKSVFSGGEHAWDLLSENKQALTQGLYLFTVKNLHNQTIKKGKFAILK